MPLYIHTLGVSDQAATARWAGLVDGAAGIAFVIFAPIWGLVGDRFGRKLMVLRSMFCATLVLGLMGFARSPIDLVVLRLMQGMLTGTIIANVALVASVTPPRHAGYTLGMMQVAVFAGASIGPMVGGLLTDTIGFRASFAVSAFMLFVGGILVKLFVKEHFIPPDTNKTENNNSFASVFAVAGFFVTVLTLFQISLANRIMTPIFPLYVEQLRGTPVNTSSVTGIILAISGIAAALSAGLFGKFGERLGYKNVLVTATLVSGLVTLPQAFVNNVTELFVLRVLFGAAAGAIMPSTNCIVSVLIPPHNLGKAYGITYSANCMGIALGGIAGGYVGASMGLPMTFKLTAIILIGTAGLALCRIRLPRAENATNRKE
ncbi:MAG: MFS transporter [Candidatus Hydrogenedentes bacterium]|nr:MFS transporter [Candidatus Hydrogenedentota bacterium]